MQKGYWVKKDGITNIYPYLSKDIELDVLVVGGGINGAINAYFLAKDGFKVGVIEKNIIGYKNTGISSACITDFMDELYVKNVKNVELNMKISKLKEKANSLLDEILVDIGNTSYLNKIDYNIISTKMFQKGMLKEEMEIRNRLGEKVSFLDGNGRYNSGINVEKSSRIVDPYELTNEIFRFISRFPNVYIFENTELISINSNLDYVEIITQNGFKITCNAVVITTGIDKFSVYRIPNISVYKRFSISLNTNIKRNMCIKILNDIPLYLRCDLSGHMIISGVDTKFNSKMNNEKYFSTIIDENSKKIKMTAKKLFPDVEFGDEISMYSGNIYNTKDMLPVISETEDMPNVYMSAAIGSSSIMQMLIGSQIIKDAVKGFYRKGMDIFNIHR